MMDDGQLAMDGGRCSSRRDGTYIARVKPGVVGGRFEYTPSRFVPDAGGRGALGIAAESPERGARRETSEDLERKARPDPEDSGEGNAQIISSKCKVQMAKFKLIS